VVHLSKLDTRLPKVVASMLQCILFDWDIGSWLLLNCFLWAMIHPMALFPTVETCMTFFLRWSCLVVLVGCWGRKARCLVSSDTDIDFLPAGCSDGAAAAEETASCTAGGGSYADASADDLA
jgi:hypothetical protein